MDLRTNKFNHRQKWGNATTTYTESKFDQFYIFVKLKGDEFTHVTYPKKPHIKQPNNFKTATYQATEQLQYPILNLVWN